MTRRDDGPSASDEAAVGIARETIGRCPNCGASIPRRAVLIEYERSSGRARFAECPECRAVVHPREAP